MKKKIILYIPLILSVIIILGANYYNKKHPVLSYYETEEGKRNLEIVKEYFRQKELAEKREVLSVVEKLDKEKEEKERKAREEEKKNKNNNKKTNTKQKKIVKSKIEEKSSKISTPKSMEIKADTPVQVQYKISPESLMNELPWDIRFGKKDAKLTIIEYMSFSCIHCKHMHNEVMPEIKKEYVDTGKAKIIYRPYSNKKNIFGSIILRCVDDSKKYDFITELFNDETWLISTDSIEALKPIAKKYGINENEFNDCISDINNGNLLIHQQKASKKLLGVEATPTFFVNDKEITGAISYKKFKKIVDKKLKEIEDAK